MKSEHEINSRFQIFFILMHYLQNYNINNITEITSINEEKPNIIKCASDQSGIHVGFRFSHKRVQTMDTTYQLQKT